MLRSRLPVKYSKVTTGPASELLTLSEAKTHLRVDVSNDDDLITLFIQVAREMIEEYCSRSLITQTREIKLDCFPVEDTIYLSHGPVQSVTEINYQDNDDATTVFAASNYWVDAHSDIGRVVVKNSWPSSYEDRPNAVTVEYVAGYGDDDTDVPAPIRAANRLLLAHLYENRNEVVSGQRVQIPFGAQVILNHYVITEDSTY